jgi:hypothetical protein
MDPLDVIVRSILNRAAKMFRTGRPSVRFSYRWAPSHRAFTADSAVFVDKQKVDKLLSPLSQKYADAKSEVIL